MLIVESFIYDKDTARALECQGLRKCGSEGCDAEGGERGAWSEELGAWSMERTGSTECTEIAEGTEGTEAF